MPDPALNLLHVDRRDLVRVLLAAACYIERYGLYLPYEWDWNSDNNHDHYDWQSTSSTPAASPCGAIAMVVYGRVEPDPVKNGSTQHLLFAHAMGEYWIQFATAREYGPHTTAQQVADDLRFTASALDRAATTNCGVNPRTPDGSPNGGGGQ